MLDNHDTISLLVPDVYYIYGGCTHPHVRPSSEAYLAHPTLPGSRYLCLEICSRKIARKGDAVLNLFYVTEANVQGTTLEVLENATILEDLRRIRDTAAARFGIEKVVIIPHINLRCRSGTRIPDRDDLYRFLTEGQTEFDVIDITRFIERERPELCLEDVLGDGYHYSHKMGELARACILEYFAGKV